MSSLVDENDEKLFFFTACNSDYSLQIIEIKDHKCREDVEDHKCREDVVIFSVTQM